MNITLPAGGKVIGLGVDIIDVQRIQSSHKRHQERFLERIYTQAEQAYCMDIKNPYPHLAVRFAAKEAVAKAFTTGIGEFLAWKSIEVAKGDRSQPIIRLNEQGQALLKEVGGSNVLISLSHTATLGHATAIIVG